MAPVDGSPTLSSIAIGSDHAGVRLKRLIVEHLRERGITVDDLGPSTEEAVDYPDFAAQVARRVSSGGTRFGILICGTGIGMGIVANKFPGVRAAVCHDLVTARLSRAHNDSNVLALGARVVGEGLALAIVDEWLRSEADRHERHRRRVEKIEQFERALQRPCDP